MKSKTHSDVSALPGALIVGGALGSLAMARSLGRRGIPVRYLTSDNTIASYSKYTHASDMCPHPDESEALPWLLRYGAEHALEGWVLFPSGDPEVRMIAENHEQLSHVFRVAIPDWNTTKWAHDKRLTYDRAAVLGIGHPRVQKFDTRSDLKDGEFRYPVVVKPTSRESRSALGSECCCPLIPGQALWG